jgi:hypothetical protein
MGALQRELTEPVMTFAPWGTTRGALEAATTSAWLTEPQEPLSRLGRSLTIRLEYLHDQAHFTSAAARNPVSANSFTNGRAHIEGRISHLRGVASQYNVPEKLDRQGKLIGFGQSMPSMTDMVELIFGEGANYRLLSGSAHGRFWAILAGSMRTNADRSAIEQHMSGANAAFLMWSSIGWFSRAAWQYFHYCGWDRAPLAALLEETYNRVGMSEVVRFWR